MPDRVLCVYPPPHLYPPTPPLHLYPPTPPPHLYPPTPPPHLYPPTPPPHLYPPTPPPHLYPPTEKEQLRQMVDGLVWFEPTLDQLHLYMDGGVAIIDQWIAAHGRHFVGTGYSTFSFRIREDRQLMGFSKESTFNSLCGGDGEEEGRGCEQPTYWPMVEATPPREDL